MVFHVYWKYDCDRCKNPICVHVNCTKMTELTKIIKYSACAPLNLHMNKKCYKTDAMNNKKRICLACFQNEHMIDVKDVINREIGKKVNLQPQKSMTKEQLYNWFERIDRFLKNKHINWNDFDDHQPYMKNIKLYYKDIEYHII